MILWELVVVWQWWWSLGCRGFGLVLAAWLGLLHAPPLAGLLNVPALVSFDAQFPYLFVLNLIVFGLKRR